jgi:hypothetical protein
VVEIWNVGGGGLEVLRNGLLGDSAAIGTPTAVASVAAEIASFVPKGRGFGAGEGAGVGWEYCSASARGRPHPGQNPDGCSTPSTRDISGKYVPHLRHSGIALPNLANRMARRL